MTVEHLRIAAHLNGPPTSGNGGYVCGLLARGINGPAEASLRAPPPLDTPLTLTHDGAIATLHHGDVLIGEAKAAPHFALEAPPAPSFAEAQAAAARFAGRANHLYPTCFVCGPANPRGLHLYTGPVVSRADLFASDWTPSTDLAGPDGRVREEFIHAALDCPSYWALPRAGEIAALLARLTSSIDAPLPRAGDRLIVAAWPLKSDGRKHLGASAVYTADGALIARAEALWIEPRA